jgi:putative endopeptidase
MKTLLAILLALALAGCATAPTAPTTDAARAGIDQSLFDPTVRPQDDLYRHVNGRWLKETKLPSDRADYGAFSQVDDQTEVQLRAIIEELSGRADLATGTPDQKIRDYHRAFLAAADRADVDLSALKADLERIDAIQSHADFTALCGRLTPLGLDLPLQASIFSDLKDPDRNEVYLSQGGLTLPDRDYYLKDEPRFAEARGLYKVYAKDLLQLAGYTADADKLLAFEAALAEISWTREALRDPEAQYNPKTLDELSALADKLPWGSWLEATTLPTRPTYIVAQPSFVAALDDLLASTDPAVLRDYLRLKLLSNYADLLGKPAFDARFHFASKGLRGVQEPRPAWKRSIGSMNWSMGELLGQVYVQRHFQPEAKARMNLMVQNLVAAYRDSVQGLEWMGEQTRAQALEKLAGFTPKVGYPDKWQDYGALEIGPDAVQNAQAVARFNFRRDVEDLSKPVDKTRWGMAPQIVNAYYNPVWNEIVFPAAILQPPFFDLGADDAVNYGGIGAVIGHELGHGFDDEGRKFDGQGKLRDWWTPEDAAAFEQRRAALQAQYDAFVVIEGKTINGEFTSGENIGDLAGLSIAYKAWKRSLNGQEAPVIDGLTGDQRFFMGWAQVWRRLYTDAELVRRLTVDPHAPSEARTNVIVRNIDAFYDAFGVKEGDKMYLPPAQRVRIW